MADIGYMAEEDNGYRTYRDLIQKRPQFVRLPDTVESFANFLSYGIQIPLIGRLLRHFFKIVWCALNRLHRKGDYIGFYDLLVQQLMRESFRSTDAYHWWHLMRFGVAVAQERQINWLARDVVLEDNLTYLGSLGPRPLKGYDVAYAFVGYSLWAFERGDIIDAIHIIKVAEQADPTWGYPEYLHGWYGLFTTGIDSVEHFARAVQIDWSFLQRMKQDKTCRSHPELLHEVQKRTLVAK